MGNFWQGVLLGYIGSLFTIILTVALMTVINDERED